MRSVRDSIRIRIGRGVATSVRRGRVGGGKHVVMNFPLTLFTAEDEQLVVCLPRYLMSCEDFLFSGEGLSAPFDHAFCMTTTLLKPTSRDKVALRSARPDAKPRIYDNCLATAEDRATIISSVRLAMDIFAQPFLSKNSFLLLPGTINPMKKSV